MWGSLELQKRLGSRPTSRSDGPLEPCVAEGRIPPRLTGPPTVLEGRLGFLQAFCGDRAHPDAVVRGPGTDWELPRVVFKPYPCNHFTHAGVDAALRLRAQALAPADVTPIELGVAKPVLHTIAEPPGAKARPASGHHAAFSGPCTVAAALLGEEVPRQRREVPPSRISPRR